MSLDWNKTVAPLLTTSERERFWARVDRGSIAGCWEWQGYRNLHRRQYGATYVHGLRRSLWAHRVAYLIEHGAIPEGMHVLHSCDNPPCVNPSHLRAGTRSDNARDMHERARWVGYSSRKTHCKNGHEFTAENTHVEIQKNGRPRRSCRICSRAATNRHYARQKEAQK